MAPGTLLGQPEEREAGNGDEQCVQGLEAAHCVMATWEIPKTRPAQISQGQRQISVSSGQQVNTAGESRMSMDGVVSGLRVPALTCPRCGVPFQQ